jgi:hypothetical protein
MAIDAINDFSIFERESLGLIAVMKSFSGEPIGIIHH